MILRKLSASGGMWSLITHTGRTINIDRSATPRYLESTKVRSRSKHVDIQIKHYEHRGSTPLASTIFIISICMASTRLIHARDIAQGKIPSDGPQRSPKWAAVRSEHLKKNPKCAVCEGTKQLNVHHIKPFHLHPELELETSNLITLCESASYGIICHILIGHLGDYKNINPKSVKDAKIWNAKLKEKNT